MKHDTRRLAERVESLRPGDEYLDALKQKVQPKATGLIALEQEIVKEAARSLGRQGQRLEEALTALRQLEAAFKKAPSEKLVAAHRAHRAEAERVLYNLKIQREALGLRNHAELERRYLIPSPLKLPR